MPLLTLEVGTTPAVIQQKITPSAAVAASVTIAGADANGGVGYTADTAGAAGNNIRVTHVVAGLSTALSVAVSGNDITVNLATDAAGVATSTATAVANAVNAHAGASVLVNAAATGTGAGLAAAAAFTNLAGGADSAGNFNGTLPIGSVSVGNGMNKFPAGTTGGLFHFEQKEPIVIQQYLFEFGASVSYTVALVNLDADGNEIAGEALILEQGTAERTKYVENLLLTVGQALKVTAGGTASMLGQVAAISARSHES